MKITLQTSTLTVFESELMATTCTLIRGKDHLLLTDPNWLPGEVETIAKYVEAIQEHRELFLFFTHSDYDHIIAYERFRANSRLIVSAAFLNNPDREDQLRQIESFYDQYYLRPPWPVSYPQTADLVIKAAQETHSLHKENYYFYQAPGHNPDGLMAFHEASGTLIVGDYLCAVEFPFIYHSVATYQQTLDLLERLLDRLPVQILVAGHGPPATDKTAMRQRLADARWYITKLLNSTQHSTPFPEDELWEKYPYFQQIQGQYHRANLELALRERKTIR